jgi:hypothetical protein
MKRKTKAGLVVCSGVFGITLGLAIVFSADRPQAAKPPQPPPFRFAKTSGVTTGFVTFQITNEGRAAILYAALAPQVKSNGQWIDLQPPSARPAVLAPRQTGTFITVPPSNNLPWRVPVVWTYGPTKLQLWKRRAENLLRHQNRGLGGMEMEKAYSPEIAP